ncbi:unnamed protein product [Lymnaea stagnalis]|uniref:C2H2-type domain-containing protein n=1 Tax=Lymnaea stagnalis TaxID=6523 RepID=A0AAV2IDU0_LYMST
MIPSMKDKGMLPSARQTMARPRGRVSTVGAFACDICGTTFTKNFNLTRHKGKCAGTKIYHCQICQKIFHRTDKLQIHMAMRHPPQILCNNNF